MKGLKKCGVEFASTAVDELPVMSNLVGLLPAGGVPLVGDTFEDRLSVHIALESDDVPATGWQTRAGILIANEHCGRSVEQEPELITFYTPYFTAQ